MYQSGDSRPTTVNFGCLKGQVEMSVASIEYHESCIAAELKRLTRCIAECERHLGQRKGAER